jgi:hypothetical protein
MEHEQPQQNMRLWWAKQYTVKLDCNIAWSSPDHGRLNKDTLQDHKIVYRIQWSATVVFVCYVGECIVSLANNEVKIKIFKIKH